MRPKSNSDARPARGMVATERSFINRYGLPITVQSLLRQSQGGNTNGK